MEIIEKIIGVMQTGGGWGLSAILMIVIWRLWTQMQEKDEKIFNLLDKQNDILKYLDKIKAE
jgi:hypothetical protein